MSASLRSELKFFCVSLMLKSQNQSLYRMIDASANRAGEGLRTMEELARFDLNDSSLTAELKSQRHDLVAAIESISRPFRLRARDTGEDVGTTIQEPGEYTRIDLASVVAAAAARTQQSLRALEEFGKTIDPTVSVRIEQIRYRCYTASAALELRIGGSERSSRLRGSHLYVLVDAGPSEEWFGSFVETLLRGAVDVIQLRDRSVDDRTLIARARVGQQIARRHQKLFIMNDRADLAVAADVDGVHVGQDELPVADARKIIGDRLIGVSTHSIEQARDAAREGADYIGCGPVFSSRTKAFDQHVGTEWLSCIVSEIDLPAFAIGGIDQTNLEQVVKTGIRRIAVSAAVRDSKHPQRVAEQLRAGLDEAR